MRLFILFFFFLVFHSSIFATHNRAGEITYIQTGDLTIIATITTYTKASSVAADRDSLELFWGDGSRQWVRRANGNGDPLPNDTKKNIYVAEHTYPGRANYIMSTTDPNRNAGILNVNPPSSENVQFHLESTVTFLNPQFDGYNNSPILLQPPIDIGCVGQPFIHNPNAYDPDGDSLAYELIVPLQDKDLVVPNYLFPNQINPGADNMISLNPVTGDFIWISPKRAGEYNIAILIKEYRRGRLLNTIIRDMQILILECDNRPPVIEVIEEICVLAGETVQFEVRVTDPDRNPTQRVKLSALGGPFEVTISPANLIVPGGFQNQPLIGTFIWNTDCSHISDRHYNVIFRAEDDFFGNLGSSTLKTVRIKVSGPPPKDPQAVVVSDEAILSWESPYACEDAADEFFRGFSIWRRNSSNQFVPDTCDPDMAGKGYQKIASNQRTIDGGRYIFRDNTAEKGRVYCYRIVPDFSRLSPAGNPINPIEGLPSKEICIQLNRDIPLITRASILETDANNGVIEIKWSKPVLPDLDTILHPGPYRYRLMRGQGFDPGGYVPVPGGEFVSADYGNANDTIFSDEDNLNTEQFSYTYQVEFYVENDRFYGSSNPASTVFTNIISTDRRVVLDWEEVVPWENYLYEIYRKNPGSPDFIKIDEVEDPSYTDRGLTNGLEYCYKILAIGTYGIENMENPLLNFSQEICGIPIDTVGPCAPVLTVTNDCAIADAPEIFENLINMLTWTNPANTCLDSEDTEGYYIFYSRTPDDPFELIQTITSASDTSLLHLGEAGLAGCYAVRAFDVNGNESILSNIVCIDNCPIYLLPNVFTPNGDGFNDFFRPILNRFVGAVEFKVFNVWGNKVFETSDPSISWNGTDSNGNDLAEGTYYYTCRVFEERLEGLVQTNTVLNGYIELIR